MSMSRDAQRLLRQKAWFDKNGNEFSRLMAQYIFMQMQLLTERPPVQGSYTFYPSGNAMHLAIQKLFDGRHARAGEPTLHFDGRA